MMNGCRSAERWPRCGRGPRVGRAEDDRRPTLNRPAGVVRHGLREQRLVQNAKRLRLSELWQNNGFVFTKRMVGRLHVNSIAMQFRKLTKETNLPMIRFHETGGILQQTSTERERAMSMHLDQLQVGMRVSGIGSDGPVTIVSVKQYGTNSAVKVFFETESTRRADSRILYRSDEGSLELLTAKSSHTFNADGRLFRLVLEAQRLRFAHLFDPQLAVTVSKVEPLPHQIAAVYDEMLPRQPLRFLLADDPGAGKTIMAGLLIKELLLRADIERCLIVVPAALDAQWQDELLEKFGLQFTLLGREQIQGSANNAFEDHNLVISRIDLLKQDENVERLANSDWDLVVFDEAHKLSATYLAGPNEIKETARYRLARMLGERSRHLVLLTATPHSGKQADFELLMALLDRDRFGGRPNTSVSASEARDQINGLMRRMLKEDLVDFDGRKLFPERFALTASYTLSDPELNLYESVTRYVREEMTRADQLIDQSGAGRRKRTVVGFALTVLQRRLASSPEAILRSLERRRARLSTTLEELKTKPSESVSTRADVAASESSSIQLKFDIDLGISLKRSRIDPAELGIDLEEGLESETDEIVDRASAARSAAELEHEVMLLAILEDQARRVRTAGVDAKWRELSALLSNPKMFDNDGRRHKLVIFTEHRDTLDYLRMRLREQLGSSDEIAFIHGGLSREERRREQAKFVGAELSSPEASVLIATDAAGEGINLQAAHLMVNYDLPWNPNRLEQRFGRIHRFGQKHACFNWNLVAANTREGDVYRTLLNKLNEAREALGGKVFDVLGQLFADRPLRDLLLDAIRQEQRTDSNSVERDVEALLSVERYREIVDRQALAREVLGTDERNALRSQMERAEASRLMPHYIAAFFLDAFRALGGVVEEREPGRYSLINIPHDLRSQTRSVGPRITERSSRICFDQALTKHARDESISGRGIHTIVSKEAALVAPGHPLFDLTVDLILGQFRDVLLQGAILVDSRQEASEVRMLVCVQDEIADERTDQNGKRRVASVQLHFIEIASTGLTTSAGIAPHLDYRPLDESERSAAASIVEEAEWMSTVTTSAETFTIEQLMPTHLAHIKHERGERVMRARTAIDDRLTKELYRLDDEIAELRRQEREGKQPKVNIDRKVREYADLKTRRQRRLAEFDLELRLTPQAPRISAVAIVIPSFLLSADHSGPERVESLHKTQRIEAIAMQEAIARERDAGRTVIDVSRENRGYDLESRDPQTGKLRLVEVKGRDARGESIVLTRNEYLCALNKRADYVLAIVQIDGETIRGFHALADPLGRVTDEGLPFGLEAMTFAITDLIGTGRV